jgi:predicted TIM-barrel fold metal-dependent hydrolase
MIDRRTVLTGAAALTQQAMQMREPCPGGAELDRHRAPKLKAPANADCHMHTYDPACFAMPPNPRPAPTNGRVEEYRLLQKRIGTTRVVIVQPRNYGTENEVTLYAIAQLGPGARGVAVVHPTITDADLKRFDAGGIRGIRFSLGDPATRAVTPDMIEPLAKRIADLGWHVQFNVDGAQVIEFQDILRRLPTPIVFDHLAHPGALGIDDPSHKIVRELIDSGRTWVKLSGAYSNSRSARRRTRRPPRSRAFVKAAPERLVWGSDWPHGVPNRTTTRFCSI